MVGDIQVHDRPSVVSRFFTRLRQDYQLLLDYGTPHPSVRWGVILSFGLIYILPILMIQGFYMITYALGIHRLIHLFVAFLTPKIDPGMALDSGSDVTVAWKRMLDDDESQFPVTLPARDIPPHQNSATPSRPRAPPPLQIFVCGDFTNNVRFTLPPSRVAKFWRIDCPMPEYLAKPEVAEVFKESVVAKIFREGPENGLKPWGHPDETELFYSTEPLLFL